MIESNGACHETQGFDTKPMDIRQHFWPSQMILPAEFSHEKITEAKDILKSSEVEIIPATTMQDAADKVVKAALN